MTTKTDDRTNTSGTFLTDAEIETLKAYANSLRVGAYMRTIAEDAAAEDLWQDHCDEAERNLIIFVDRLVSKAQARGYRKGRERS